MASSSPYFWTDLDQAQQRLTGSVVMYDDYPVHIHQVESGASRPESPEIPRAYQRDLRTGQMERKRLDSPKYNKFRTLPPLGFVNSTHGLTYCERAPIRSVVHGHNRNNVGCGLINENGQFRNGAINFSNLTDDFERYSDSVMGKFPSMEECVERLVPRTAVAFSRDYAIYQDSNSLNWLLRREEMIGLVPGRDTLFLLGKKRCYREELEECPEITVGNIREL